MELVTCFLVLSFKEIVNDVIVGLATFLRLWKGRSRIKFFNYCQRELQLIVGLI